MNIRWLGHSCFVIMSENGVRVVIDPYNAAPELDYAPPGGTAEVVLTSHGHFDHNNVSAIGGNPLVFTSAGSHSIKGIVIRGVNAVHDQVQGKERGRVVIFCLLVDGIRLCHCGDLGQPSLTVEQVAEIGLVDVLMVPVGGNYTIDWVGARAIVEQLSPKVVLPMHYKTAKVKFPLAGVDEFLKGAANVVRSESSEIEVNASTLPLQRQIIVLKAAN